MMKEISRISTISKGPPSQTSRIAAIHSWGVTESTKVPFLCQRWRKWWVYGVAAKGDLPAQMLTPDDCIAPPDVALGGAIDDPDAYETNAACDNEPSVTDSRSGGEDEYAW